MSDQTPYLTPAMLRSSNVGLSWSTFPKPGAAEPDQIAAQTDICQILTSEMDAIANQTLRANAGDEQDFGPDWRVTVMQNGWTRFRLSRWPVSRIVSGAYSTVGSAPPVWQAIPASAILIERSGLQAQGTTVPAGIGSAPTAALISPGYIGWQNGRNGYIVRVTTITGYPVAGIDQDALKGATSIHVDDITGWEGARGTIYDPPYRETVNVVMSTPDLPFAIAGPGTLELVAGLQFTHTPLVGSATATDQTILLSAMPQALLQAGYFMAAHYGLIRGATAGVVQTTRGATQTSGMGKAMDWYDRAAKIISRFAGVAP